jgi:hypothetical protein
MSLKTNETLSLRAAKQLQIAVPNGALGPASRLNFLADPFRHFDNSNLFRISNFAPALIRGRFFRVFARRQTADYLFVIFAEKS